MAHMAIRYTIFTFGIFRFTNTRFVRLLKRIPRGGNKYSGSPRSRDHARLIALSYTMYHRDPSLDRLGTSLEDFPTNKDGREYYAAKKEREKSIFSFTYSALQNTAEPRPFPINKLYGKVLLGSFVVDTCVLGFTEDGPRDLFHITHVGLFQSKPIAYLLSYIGFHPITAYQSITN